MYSDSNLSRMAEIANEVISKSRFKENIRKITPQYFDDDDKKSLVYWSTLRTDSQTIINGNNEINSLFENLATNRRGDQGQFYHFKSFDIAIQIVTENKIQISSLLNQSDNDHAEYGEFFMRTGFYGMACDGQIEKNKKNIFILCFTKNFREERFWSDYANNDSGVCLVFRIKDKDFNSSSRYFIRDVYYDHGYSFDFINDLRYMFKKEFGKEIFIDGINNFAQFFKRKKYEWENETRLSFNYNELTSCSERPFEVKTEAKRRYVVIPFENNFFDLKIEEVICGRKVNHDDVRRMQNAVGPNINVWRR